MAVAIVLRLRSRDLSALFIASSPLEGRHARSPVVVGGRHDLSPARTSIASTLLALIYDTR